MPIPVVIAWNQVTTSIDGEPLEVVAYQIIVDTFQVTLPAEAGTIVTVTPELLVEGTEYGFEILAIEEGGNQTITQGW